MRMDASCWCGENQSSRRRSRPSGDCDDVFVREAGEYVECSVYKYSRKAMLMSYQDYMATTWTADVEVLSG